MLKKIIEFVVGLFFISLGLIPFVILAVPRLNEVSPILAIASIMIICSGSFAILWFNTFGKDDTVKKEDKS